jgi:hypothetical protein
LSPIVGTWDLTIKTPIGSLSAVYVFAEADGAMTGTAESRSELVPLIDIACVDTADGHHVTWRQTVTRPMRLNLEFDVTARGPTLVGHSRAGKLPRSTVTGTRRSPAGCDV